MQLPADEQDRINLLAAKIKVTIADTINSLDGTVTSPTTVLRALEIVADDWRRQSQ